MSKSKNTEHICSYCGKLTKMSYIGDMAGDQIKKWYKCTRCHHLSLLNIETKKSEAKGEGVETKTHIYDPCTTYPVGAKIFHSEFNDIGKVTKKIKTSDGSSAILVLFEKNGERKLLENYKPNEIYNE